MYADLQSISTEIGAELSTDLPQNDYRQPIPIYSWQRCIWHSDIHATRFVHSIDFLTQAYVACHI